MSKGLRTCPFCGEEPQLLRDGHTVAHYCKVINREMRTDSAEQWNHRVGHSIETSVPAPDLSDDALKDKLSYLREMIRSYPPGDVYNEHRREQEQLWSWLTELYHFHQVYRALSK